MAAKSPASLWFWHLVMRSALLSFCLKDAQERFVTGLKMRWEKMMLRKIVNKLNVVVFSVGLFVPIVSYAAPVLWSGDSSGRLGTIDVVTGNVNVIGSMGVTMTDIAFDPAGNLWGITFGKLYKIDKTTAASTFVGDLGPSTNSLVFNTSGVLYTANSSLYTVDTATGAASLVGNGGYSYSSSGDLAFVGSDLFLSSTRGDNLVKINTSDGSGSLVGNIGFSSVFGLASPNRADLFGLAGFSVLSIDSTTGVGTSILDYSGQGLDSSFGSAFVTEAVVPIPAAVWLFGSGLIGLLWKRKTIQ
jgi:hypothetical protein